MSKDFIYCSISYFTSKNGIEVCSPPLKTKNLILDWTAASARTFPCSNSLPPSKSEKVCPKTAETPDNIK